MSADPLASIGKGIVQLNLRLNRVLELLERPGAPASEERELLFELLDAFERPARRAGWWSRLLGRAPATDAGLGRGIEVARARARERLLDPDKVIERELGTLHVPDPGSSASSDPTRA